MTERTVKKFIQGYRLFSSSSSSVSVISVIALSRSSLSICFFLFMSTAGGGGDKETQMEKRGDVAFERFSRSCHVER